MNLRPPPYQSGTLPTELLVYMVVGERFERSNDSVKDCCVTASPPDKKGQEGWSCTNSISICPPDKFGGGGGSRTHYLLGMSQSCKLLHFTAILSPLRGNLINEQNNWLKVVLSGGSSIKNELQKPLTKLIVYENNKNVNKY